MGMQKTLGGLAEGIRNLTEQSKGHDEELKKVCRDVHAAKVVVGVVGALFVAAATFLGFVVKAYLDYLWRTPVKESRLCCKIRKERREFLAPCAHVRFRGRLGP